MASASFICALIAAFFAGSSGGAQDVVPAAQHGTDDDSLSGPFVRSVSFGPLFMRRASPDNIPLAIDNSGAGPVIVSGSDFQFDFEAGVEASLLFDHPNLPAPLEARYFWISDWFDSRSAAGLTNAVVNTTPNVGNFSTLDYARYQSQLQSFELNFRRQIPCDVTLMIGLRYVSFDEDLDLLFDGGDRFWWGIENDLFGVQLGAQRALYDNCCGFTIEGFIKAGIYGNDAKVATQVMLVEQAAISQRNGMDHVAFVGELGLFASYDICRCWNVRAGYQVMWLDGVLVAANQVPATDNNALTINFDYTDVLFHGAMLQVERRW
jgi:hypothetical protein